MHSTYIKEPLKSSGTLDGVKMRHVTPLLGTEILGENLKEWITGPDSDAKLRDLAIFISQRGVVAFRAQTDMDPELQKQLARRLGLLSGKPAECDLWKHPMSLARGDDPDCAKLDAKVQQSTHWTFEEGMPRQTAADEWHVDACFETNPPDYTTLRMTSIPPTGGDTMFASSYELYDRLSPPFQKMFEGLKIHYHSASLSKAVKASGKPYPHPRGAPGNVGYEFENSHPLVRTNPVTGWKALYSGVLFAERIEGVTEIESKQLLEKIQRLITENHDLQIRVRWENPGDIVIWDNRSVLHAATQDHHGQGDRIGWRATSIGEKPYFDPASVSRKQALAAAK
ncbi:Alpha-ketoglutarate-dependent taurine dioxygenase [Lasiodiplodia hormozganensis]|uniref:Alpha-ketoglutarate-dependent taurine dioxygenase n=2 Tax=Lasiodiplodia TaxID=66739 RepID=A0A5N5CZ59_9PEZI|nr:Alpha-ketoglutarate-dependent sulfonate dioxygenase [Lasiodiplodia theobromae]KAB2570668.1 Alpha-ketoglutarate-dependent taurine dioxygenase [Lasiodiplodia theobromae]KAF4540625.1 Alpha-ketoglutarate-dependent sulfonate dioxygenase [Lasiodiplodia theobromae]KAK0647827.1 Alpha-ketoglutarate-dependent taurine dioxygenase [Lasiodiplodia hormozganensis]